MKASAFLLIFAVVTGCAQQTRSLSISPIEANSGAFLGNPLPAPSSAAPSPSPTPVAPGSLVVTVPILGPAIQAQAYNAANGGNGTPAPSGAILNISGGTAPYTCSVASGSLPTGLILSEVTPQFTPSGLCILTGTPTAAGDFPLTLSVKDGASHTASAALVFVVTSSTTPVISNFNATSVSPTSETISWTTDVPADSRVAYGETYGLGYESPEQDSAGVTSHSVTLTGLIPGMEYYYAVISSGISGGVSQDYLQSHAGYYDASFTTASGSSAGTFDFGMQGSGPHHVVQGFPMYVALYNWYLSGSSNWTPGTFKIQITGLPPNSQVHWPDQQDFALGQGTISTTTTTNDTMTMYSPGGTTQFSILTNVGGTTPAGNYTLSITATTQGLQGAAGPTHSLTWTMGVCAPNSACGGNGAFSAGAPASYPPIPSLGTWQANMTTYGAQWANQTCLAGYDEQVEYYDGEHVYNQIAAYTGNTALWNPAALNSRSCYMSYGSSANWNIPGYWVFPHGLYDDCVSGSATAPASCAALHSLAASAAGATMWANSGDYADSQNIREGCYRLGALRLDYDAGGGSTLAYVKAAAAYCLGDVDQVINGTGNFEESFMDGLASQALIEYYSDPKTGNGDIRVPQAIQSIADHLWAENWIPWNGTNGMFTYNPFISSEGINQPNDQTVTNLEGINLLVAPLFAWVYRQTGQQKYQLEGDTIWYAGVNDPPSGSIGWSGKLFSQQYRWSFDYVNWRSAP